MGSMWANLYWAADIKPMWVQFAFLLGIWVPLGLARIYLTYLDV